MAKTVTVTNGSTSVAFIGAGTTGNGFSISKWSQGVPTRKQLRRSSHFAEGEIVVHDEPNNVVEVLTIALQGSSQDNWASRMQTLRKLREEAVQFRTKLWQNTPVYLQVQTEDETGIRYATIIDMRIVPGGNASFYEEPFDDNYFMGGFTLYIERVTYWSDNAPQTVPTALTLSAPQAPAGQDNALAQFVSNYRDENAITHIYNYDLSATAFSANQIAVDPWTLWVVSGSTPAVGDIIYIGSTTGPFYSAVFNITTAQNASGVTFSVKYYNGSWVTNSGLTHYGFGSVGVAPVAFDGKEDWATTAINGVTAYWIAISITAISSWTTSPINSGQVVYGVRDNYISIANTQVDGEVPALAQIRVFMPVQTTDAPHMVIMGMKSRGLTTFTGRLNFGGQNPGTWIETYDTDTSKVADEAAPGGNRATVTFATSQSINANRVNVSLSASAEELAMEGEYRVYARVQQIGGAAGDCAIRLSATHSVEIDGPIKTLQTVGSGPEVIDLGRLSVLPMGVLSGDNANLNLQLNLRASSSNGSTPDLYLYDFTLIPTDEWSFVAHDSGLGRQSIGAKRGLVIDAGIEREGVMSYLLSGSSKHIISLWEARGQLPRLPPSRAVRLYFMFLGTSHTSYNGQLGLVEVRAHDRWELLRGAD